MRCSVPWSQELKKTMVGDVQRLQDEVGHVNVRFSFGDQVKRHFAQQKAPQDCF